MKTKSIQIDADVHKKLKEYCDKAGLKIGTFVSSIINNKIDHEKE